MEHIDDNIIIVMIILVVLIFLKAIFYYLSLSKLSNAKFEKFRTILSSILDALLMITSLFILFFRKNNTMIILLLAIIFFLKGVLHFSEEYNLYKYTSLSQINIDAIKNFKHVYTFITNSMLFIGSFYMLKIIFIK